jgi:predicted permease
MGIFELLELSKKVYKEIAFQSMFSLRAGGTLPQDAGRNITELAKNAERNITMNKVIMTFYIAFYGIFLLLSGATPDINKELTVVASISAILGVVLFMITFMGLQMVTSFVSSKVGDALIVLPISKKDVSKILLICFIRIFDIPLITTALVIPIAYGILYRSLLGALTTFLSVILTEIFALSLAVFLAISFYSKVVSGGGRSKWGMLIRIFYMLVWIIPMFLMYEATNFAVQITSLMKTLTLSFSYLLGLLYPFSLGFLVSFTTFFDTSKFEVLVLSFGSSLIYLVLAAYSFKWLIKRTISVGIKSTTALSKEAVADTVINPGPSWLGIIKKDIRMASRSPSYFSILAMPTIQAIIFGLSFNVDQSVFFSSFWMLLVPPILLSIESTAYSYTVCIPIRRKTMILAKTILSLISYLVALFVLLILTFIKEPSLIYNFILFQGICMFSIVASIIIEIILLFRIFGKNISGNIYSKFYFYIVPLIISYVIAIAPRATYFLVLFFTASTTISIGSMSVISILEFVLALILLAF